MLWGCASPARQRVTPTFSRELETPRYFTALQAVAFGSGRRSAGVWRCVGTDTCPGAELVLGELHRAKSLQESRAAQRWADCAAFLVYFFLSEAEAPRHGPAGRCPVGQLKAGGKRVEEPMGNLLCQRALPGTSVGLCLRLGWRGC